MLTGPAILFVTGMLVGLTVKWELFELTVPMLLAVTESTVLAFTAFEARDVILASP